MNLSTFLIAVFIFIIVYSLSFLIQNNTYKIFYFLIMGLGAITFLNIYLGIIYYVKLRNDPGIPGPRGPKGKKGPRGMTGKCIINESCSFSRNDAINMILDRISNKFDSTSECILDPSIDKCGSLQEVNRINDNIIPVFETIKKVAFRNNKIMNKQELEATLNSILFE